MDAQGERLRLLYPDLHGLERAIPARRGRGGGDHRVLRRRVAAHARQGDPAHPSGAVRRGPARRRGDIDHDTLRPSWEPDTTLGIADMDSHGQAAPWDSRQVLRHAVKPWRQLGLIPQLAFELEFDLLEPDGGGGWRPVPVPWHRVYGTGMAVDPKAWSTT